MMLTSTRRAALHRNPSSETGENPLRSGAASGFRRSMRHRGVASGGKLIGAATDALGGTGIR
jgi:hypothetical protein